MIFLKQNTSCFEPLARQFVPRISYVLREVPIRQIKVWGEAQARKLDRESIAELAKSIRHDGLLNPPLVQKVSKDEYLLMSGQRRLAALKRLRAKKVRVNVLTRQSKMSLEQAKAASVVENIHRNDMSSRDVIAAATLLTEKMGKAEAARYLGIARRTLNSYLGFAGVPDTLRELVPETMSREDMARLYLAVPGTKRARNIALRLQNLDSQLKKHYISLLSQYPKMSHPKLLKKARASMVRQNISLKLTKGAAKRLKQKAERNSLTVNDMAKQILDRHLKR